MLISVINFEISTVKTPTAATLALPRFKIYFPTISLVTSRKEYFSVVENHSLIPKNSLKSINFL